MRRTIPLTLAAIMTLGAAPALAQDAEESAAPAPTERAESTLYGLAVELPAEWSVTFPEGERVSAITDAEGQPVMEATVVYANGGGGTWCDVDAYLGLAEDATLEGHAYAYVNFLQQTESADAQMVVIETDIPAGPAYRIEIFEPSNGRIRAMYLVDGPMDDDGLRNRYLLSCASRDASQPFWEDIAGSVEVMAPMAESEAEMTEETASED